MKITVITKCVAAAMVAIASTLTACAQQKGNKKDSNMETTALVAYFSATGTTKGVAEQIAETTGGKLLEIQPQQAYSSVDLDWTVPTSRSCRENADTNSRPAIVKPGIDVAAFDTIYLGYPIWWDRAPRVVNTFIESCNLKGKTVIPFATSGGSGIANSVRELKKSYPDVKWQSGRLLNGASTDEIRSWLEK